MAIATDSYENIVYSGSTITRIGLSKSLNNYSLDELYDYIYCAFSNRLYKLILERQNSNINTYGDTDKVPYVVTTSGTQVTVNNGVGEILDERGDYQFIVWLKGSRSEAGTYSIYQYQLTDFKMVTEWDAPNYYYKLPSPVSTFGTCATAWNDDESTVKTTWSTVDGHGELFYRYVNGGTINDISLSSNSIYPYAMFKRGSRIYLKQLRQNAPAFMATVAKGSDYYTGGSWIYSVQPDDPGISVAGGNFVNPAYVQPDMTDSPTDPFTYYYDEAGINRKIRYCKTSDNAVIGRVSYNGSNPAQYLGIESYFSNKHQSLLFWAGCGIKFYADKLYKPIIKDGYVEDYTDNMDTESDLDNWSGNTKHTVPITPPSPPAPDNPWDVDPETYGWSGGEVSGMVKYYLLTAGQMSSLQTAIRSNANWTIDYLNCIVSCFVVPNSGIFFDAPIPTTVKFKLDNATEWDTGVGCSRIQGTKNKSGGTIEIPRLTNTFYDFEPYSDYSVYIPFCGRVPIKGNVCLGHEIKVTYYPDVPTCSLTAIVSCGGVTIAIAKGSFGTMTPVTSNGSDRKTAAVIGDVAPIITGIGTGIVGVALGNPLIVGAGAAQALGGIMGGVKETVQSYAYSVGSTGDSSFFSAGNRCYYYANYPLIDEVVNNSMFGHSVGYLCNTVGKLSEFKGFTICANPHVTFSSSAEEREEIERLLSMGVIL